MQRLLLSSKLFRHTSSLLIVALWLSLSDFRVVVADNIAAPVEDSNRRNETRATSSRSDTTVELSTKIHRLNSRERSVYDAFVYVNRIPNKPEDDESYEEFSGRVFGRLANQEGRILLKAPPGMGMDAYLGYKTFLSTEGQASVGNCVACHTPPKFTDLKSHIVDASGKSKVTPSLRNIDPTKLKLDDVLRQKLASARQKQSGDANSIDEAYESMRLNERDLQQLAAFLKLLKDLPDDEFRNRILKAELLDTSELLEN